VLSGGTQVVFWHVILDGPDVQRIWAPFGRCLPSACSKQAPSKLHLTGATCCWVLRVGTMPREVQLTSVEDKISTKKTININMLVS
jgi:hypothetical protein